MPPETLVNTVIYGDTSRQIVVAGSFGPRLVYAASDFMTCATPW